MTTLSSREKRRTDIGSLRQLLDRGVGLFQQAEFYRLYKYCGYCGHMKCTSEKANGRCSPSTAVSAITRKLPTVLSLPFAKTIILAQHTRHRNGVYTILVGFVEVGETLEQDVARGVMEESSIQVKYLRYVSSQPWSFPQSLMTAFMTDYHSGEINIDTKELLDAAAAITMTSCRYCRRRAPGAPTVRRYLRPVSRGL